MHYGSTFVLQQLDHCVRTNFPDIPPKRGRVIKSIQKNVPVSLSLFSSLFWSPQTAGTRGQAKTSLGKLEGSQPGQSQ
jgi:hypothetical protein